MDNNPIKTAVRRTAREAREDQGICALCGRKDRLVHIPRKRRLIEDHHVSGRNHDSELTIPVCRHCHDQLTEGLLAAGVSMLFEPDPKVRVATILDADAVFFEQFAKSQRRLSALLRGGSK
jgi:hypothetical protein